MSKILVHHLMSNLINCDEINHDKIMTLMLNMTYNLCGEVIDDIQIVYGLHEIWLYSSETQIQIYTLLFTETIFYAR